MSDETTKPAVNTEPVANNHAADNELIIEYSGGKHDPSTGMRPGGLISLRTMDDGTLRVDLYRHDPTVTIIVGEATG